MRFSIHLLCPSPTITKQDAVYIAGMASGLEIRAEIDAQIAKALILIHGGGSIALLTFLQFVLGEKSEYDALAYGILWGLVCYQIGIIFAIIYSWLTRKCSLVYEQNKMTPPPCGNFLGFKLTEPCVCHARILFMYLSLIAFVVAGFSVFCGGRETLEQKRFTAPPVKQMPKSKSP
ncbi:MAG: hypothetical protein K0Q83_2918 [Deltaproteobacteria bacterium]|jgi:hypothetical protein|nr:hypothetical protein [Deltaproteobacteria bacterium]